MNHASSVAPARCEEALRRALASTAFSRASKLQRFLQFVGETTLRGDGALLHEHLVAVEVFGRSEAFAGGEDSVVRRQAHALRRKLRDYYDTEGKDDPVQITLPVGGYAPVFRERTENPVIEPPAGAPPSARRHIPAWAVALGVVLGVGAAFAAGWSLRGVRLPAERTATSPDPAIREIWEPWLSRTGGAVLTFSNPPGTSVRLFPGPIQPNPEHQGIPVSPGQDARFREFFRFPNGGNIYLYPLSSQAKMGEALAAVPLTRFFTGAGVPVRAMQSRFATWETMREENLILLGHADSNRWIEPVLANAPFRLAPTDQQRRARILNPNPRAGERPEYLPTLPDENTSYALISLLPGVDGTHQIGLVGGLDTSSTTAAAEYLTTGETVAQLLKLLKSAAPDHKGTWHFQVILQTDVRDTVPVNVFPVAVRVL